MTIVLNSILQYWIITILLHHGINKVLQITRCYPGAVTTKINHPLIILPLSCGSHSSFCPICTADIYWQWAELVDTPDAALLCLCSLEFTCTKSHNEQRYEFSLSFEAVMWLLPWQPFRKKEQFCWSTFMKWYSLKHCSAVNGTHSFTMMNIFPECISTF